MAHVEAKKHLPVEADALWREVGSFQGVGEWHPMLADVEGDGEHAGAQRVATSGEGQQQVERLVEVDQARRRTGRAGRALPLSSRGRG